MSWSPPPPPPPPPPFGGAAVRETGEAEAGRWTLLGLAIAAGSVVVGGVLVSTAGGSTAQRAAGLARMTMGCRTVIEVEESSDVVLFSETRGALSAVEGSCPTDVGPFELGIGSAPRIEVVITDTAGQPVEIAPTAAPGYDTGAYRGAALGSASLRAGTYTVFSSSEEPRAVLAIGRPPSESGAQQRTSGALVAGVGALAGALLVWWGRRLRPSASR